MAVTLWGDGFAQDSLGEFWAVKDWSACSPDEYILLFPRLVPASGAFPDALRVHLETCVAVRSWRLARRGGPVPLRSRVSDGDGARRHGDWFADHRVVSRVLRGLGLLRPAPGRGDAERHLLLFLDGLLSDLQSRRHPAWSEASEALLAFGAGIHPAYLWPQATVSDARGVAAGWLGHLDRGRTALMPMVVADYVLDALGGASSDRHLVDLAGGEANLERLRAAARRRAAGHDPSVRLAPGSTTLAAFVAGRSSVPLGIGT